MGTSVVFRRREGRCRHGTGSIREFMHRNNKITGRATLEKAAIDPTDDG